MGVGARRGRMACRAVALSLLLVACGAFPFSPNEVRLDEAQRDRNAKNLSRLPKGGPEPIRLAVLGDVQIWQTELVDAVDAINDQGAIDLVIQVGDLTQFALADEFRWVAGRLDELSPPSLAVIGNHDILANGRAIYGAMFGATDFFFDLGATRFVFLDDNSREVDFDGTVPNLFFLEAALSEPPPFERAVVVSHVPPWDGDFDRKLEADFVSILEASRVVLSLHGHRHRFFDGFRYGGSVRFTVADSMKERAYLRITLGSEGVSVDRVPF